MTRVTPLRTFVFAALALSLSAVLVACGTGGGGTDAGDDDDGGVPDGCTSHDQCGSAAVCAGGSCVIGECVDTENQLCRQEGGPPADVAPYCCKPWQLCDFSYTCVLDPASPVFNQCEVHEDCPDPGQFCSGGQCFDSAGRTPCTATFQCPEEERCDRTVYLCVPDIGGCELCDVGFPELCCEEGAELCDVETGFCLALEDIECDSTDDCRAGQVCDPFGRCVQCISDDDCGPGTSCNEGTGNCYSITFACESDQDCDPPRRCAPATDECVNPQCVGDAQCIAEDPRQRCDLSTFTCYLPPPTCTESDEPNDEPGTATALVNLAHQGTLCRANVDYLSFPVAGDRRYRVTVTTADYNAGGVAVSLLGPAGGVADTDTFASFENSVTVTLITAPAESGTALIRVDGTGDEVDLWPFTVVVEETEAPMVVDCDDEAASGVEPNETFGEAHDIGPGAHVFARCDQDDVDYYRITLPVQHALDVTVEFEDDLGDLAIELYDEPSAAGEIDSSDGITNIERVEAPEGLTVYWLRVALYSSFATGEDGQTYTINVQAVPRPPVCDDDVGEPGNDTFSGASALALNTSVEHLHCVPIDVDVHRLDIPANYGGTLDLDFVHGEGDLRLELYDPSEELISSSNVSTAASSKESIELPFSAEAATYYARVRLHGGSSTVGQAYVLYATTYDATVCLSSEPVSNNSALAAQCVGDFTTSFPCPGPRHDLPLVAPDLATCAASPDTAGCGTACGRSDEDWFRVGTLNNGQLLRARLEYVPPAGGGGTLGIGLARGNQDLSHATFVEYNPDVAASGLVEIELNAPTVDDAFAREYLVAVVPEGDEGFAALPYTVSIEVGAPCFADDGEPNENPGQSTLVRTSGSPGVPYSEAFDRTVCNFDNDVFELFAFVGETVRATLLGNPGTTVDLGSRPTPITDPAPTIPGGAGMPAVGNCALEDGDAGSAGLSCTVAEIANDTVRQVYVTVRRTSTDAESTGPYQLLIEVE